MKQAPSCVQQCRVSTGTRFPQYRRNASGITFIARLFTSIFLCDLLLAVRTDSYAFKTMFLENSRIRRTSPDTTSAKITVLDVTNSTALLEWDVPQVTNGISRWFVVSYGNESMKIMDENETRCQLQNLESYTTYNVTLQVCAGGVCSKVGSVTLRTTIGSPSSVVIDYAVDSREKTLTFQWQKPEIPNGPNPAYEFVTIKEDGIRKTNSSLKTTETYVDVRAPDCGDPKWSYTFVVRAFNDDSESGTGIHYGPWSNTQILQCVILQLAPAPSLFFVYLLLFIFLAILSVYGVAKVYLKFRT